MKLTFLGTRGGIIVRSPLHFMHSVLLIQFRKTSILLDWGSDWLGKKPPRVDGLLLTHGHPDHVGGLAAGFPAPVYATEQTLSIIHHYPIKQRIAISNQKPFTIGSIRIEPFEVYHSLRAPAVGYRIQAGKRSLFYVSDLIAIKDEKKALTGIDLYIGDGAIITRRILVRDKEGIPTGHSPIKDQLAWCQQLAVPQAIFTHCGSEIVKSDLTTIATKIAQLELSYKVKTRIAIDGSTFTL